MEIPKELKDDIWEYCRINNITNVDEFSIKLLRQGFTVEKYGATPVAKTVEKIVEKIVEVPVEKIVEKIVEVPVTMVDSELSNKYTELVSDYEASRKELETAKQTIASLTNLLQVEKQKNKKDFYGEK